VRKTAVYGVFHPQFKQSMIPTEKKLAAVLSSFHGKKICISNLPVKRK